MYTRHHVNDHGGGSYYIDHLDCTDHDCGREHHFLLTLDDIADIIGTVLDDAHDRGVDAEHNGSVYYIRRLDDTSTPYHDGIYDNFVEDSSEDGR